MHSSEDPEHRQLTETPVLKYLKSARANAPSEDPGKKGPNLSSSESGCKNAVLCQRQDVPPYCNVEYFGEHAPHFCGKCSVCLSHDPVPSKNISWARKIRTLLNCGLRPRISKEKGISHRIFSDQTLYGFASVRQLLILFFHAHGRRLRHPESENTARILIEIRAWKRYALKSPVIPPEVPLLFAGRHFKIPRMPSSNRFQHHFFRTVIIRDPL